MKMIACAALLFAEAAAAAQVHIHTGTLQGIVTSDVVAYKGIPYAEPPIGSLRWRSPIPAHAWKGVRAAQEFGHACLQPPQQPTGLYSGGMAPMSEDCLTLNVWAPSNAARGLPVGVRLPDLVLSDRKAGVGVDDLELARSIGHQRHQAQLVSSSKCSTVRDIGRRRNLTKICVHYLERMCSVTHGCKNGRKHPQPLW